MTITRYIIVALFGLSMSYAVAEGPSNFDHYRTGFPLTGAHQQVRCSECHLNGVFVGTPRACEQCHNDRIAEGKPKNHVVTVEQCDRCHNTSSWDQSQFDHASVTAPCESCHNGTKAQGKGAGHMPTSNNCVACHISNRSFANTHFDHNETRGTCSGCHNGATRQAKGKNARHVATTQECSACHTPGTPWESAVFDHTGIASNCVSCHVAGGTANNSKPADHMPTSDSCEACHRTTEWTAIAKVVHSEVRGACSNCHNDQIAVGKSVGHIQTTDECSACHSTNDWEVTKVDHTNLVNDCVSCHNGTTAKTKTASHIPTSTLCEACHNPNAPSFTPVTKMDHTQALSPDSCDICHNGIKATGKPAGHIQTADQCGTCHKDPSTGSWADAKVDHSTINSGCIQCHVTGGSATAKPANHIRSSSACEACHSPTAPDFKPVEPANVDHREVIGVCSSCHNDQIASGKPAGHLTTSAECDTCHTNSATTHNWSDVTAFNHEGITNNCISCHVNGGQAKPKPNPPAHIASSNACETCHTIGGSFNNVANVDHNNVVGTCDNAGCHTKPGTHLLVKASAVCEDCHRKRRIPTWSTSHGSRFHSALIGPPQTQCASCHSRRNHHTGRDCGESGCHTYPTWDD